MQTPEETRRRLSRAISEAINALVAATSPEAWRTDLREQGEVVERSLLAAVATVREIGTLGWVPADKMRPLLDIAARLESVIGERGVTSEATREVAAQAAALLLAMLNTQGPSPRSGA